MKLYKWSERVQEVYGDYPDQDPILFSCIASLLGLITYIKN
ncbi:hypothetical protein [Bacillus sp. S14(2024)]